MIPKIIHYCWLSDDPIPTKFKNYMDTWQKFLPDYQFIKWDFNRFDINSSVWVKEAFENKKYAFAADYIRLYALYTQGGFYLDMDVEVKKSLDSFLELSTCMCWQAGEDNGLEVAALGTERGCIWVKDCMKYYENKHFVNPDGTRNERPMPKIIEENILSNGYKLVTVQNPEEAATINNNSTIDIPVFTSDYFSPKNYDDLKIYSTANTVMIHHFAGSWIPDDVKMKMRHPKLFKYWYWLVYLPRYEWKTKVLRRNK